MYGAYGQLLDDVPFGVEGFGDGVGDDSGVAKGDNEILEGQDLFVSCWLRTRIESAVFITVKGASCGGGEDDACSLGACDKGCDAMVHVAAAVALDSPDPKFHYDLWPPDSLPICLTS